MRIRKLKKEDYEQIKSLEEQTHIIHQKSRPDIFEKIKSCNVLSLEDFLQCFKSKKYYNYVCVENNKVIGLIFAFEKPNRSNSIMKKRRVMFIYSLSVDKNYRRMGVGTKLMQHIKKVAKNNNFESIELNVWAFNKQAISFYKKLGMTLKTMVYETKI